jgi:hypothetical protein
MQNDIFIIACTGYFLYISIYVWCRLLLTDSVWFANLVNISSPTILLVLMYSTAQVLCLPVELLHRCYAYLFSYCTGDMLTCGVIAQVLCLPVELLHRCYRFVSVMCTNNVASIRGWLNQDPLQVTLS